MNPQDASLRDDLASATDRAFHDRRDAGRLLAARLAMYAGRRDLLVLGLARGGIPVAGEIAQALHAPLDVFIIRKLGVPEQPELAMGAIASGGVRVMNHDIVSKIEDGDIVLEGVAVVEQRELERREREYRGDRPMPSWQGKTVIVADDGLATGASMMAAVEALRASGAAQVIVAVPVGSPSACARIASVADELVCLTTPARFEAVGQVYGDFSQTSDVEVRAILQEFGSGRDDAQK